MLNRKKLAALFLAAAGVLPILGCFDLPLNMIADWITIIDHFEGQIPGF